jgi:hypothetical protein
MQRILIVADGTGATRILIDEVAARARREPCRFALLIPDVPRGERADWTLAVALPLLERAAGGPVPALADGRHPVRAIKQAVAQRARTHSWPPSRVAMA